MTRLRKRGREIGWDDYRDALAANGRKMSDKRFEALKREHLDAASGPQVIYSRMAA